MVTRRLIAVLVLTLTGLSAFLVHARDRAEPRQQLTSTSVARPSGTDMHFAHMMVMHHEQAVRMSRALIAKPDVPERIRLIADFIAHDQQREIDVTNEWLTAWGEQPVAAADADAAGHGMLTEQQMSALDRAGTQQAGPLFLRLMIEHHRGAVTMSRSLLDAPAGNSYVHSMAKHVVNEQGAEIDAMSKLLR